MLPGAAAADGNSGADETVDQASLSSQIDATVQNPDARAAFQEILQSRIDEGATQVTLSSSDYLPDTKRVQTGTLAYPSDCKLSVLVSYSPGRATVDLLSSCTRSSWQKNVMQGWLHGWSPVNPIINATLADTTVIKGGPALYATHTVNYRCQNTNRTYIQGGGQSTLTIGTTKYHTRGVDDMTVNCGW